MKVRVKSFRRQNPSPKIRSIRLADRDGKFEIDGFGAWYSYWRDPYHLMLAIPWLGFIAIVSIGYIAINTIFALLYLAGGDCLSGTRPGSFADAFFFSVQTLGSIGYGVFAPKTTYAHIIVTLEAIASLLSIALVTGLAFARFTKPTARAIFSKVAVISLHNGIPTLMFRMANERGNQILEAQLKLYLLKDELTPEGQFFYRIYELKLLRSQSPSFSLSWTAMHPIDETSPLFNSTPESLVENHAQIIVSLTGTDDITHYTVHLRHIYTAKNILFDRQFQDIIYKSPNGDRYFDYSKFHDVI
jgi:inward rectifier potassium channel